MPLSRRLSWFPLTVTVSEDRDFKELIKVNWDPTGLVSL